MVEQWFCKPSVVCSNQIGGLSSIKLQCHLFHKKIVRMLQKLLTSISLAEVLILPKKREQNLTHSLIGSTLSISNMKINLWYCADMKQWRWTLTDASRPIIKQESGQRPFLRDAMNDVANTVEYMLNCTQND